MRRFAMACIALAAFAGQVNAHPVGRVCAYDTQDVDGQSVRVTDYCHHIIAGTPAVPYEGGAGITLRFGGGGWHDRWWHGWGGGWRGDWRGGWHGGGWRHERPGVSLNFGGGRHGGGLCIGNC